MLEYMVRPGDQYAISFPILLDKYIITPDMIKGIEDKGGDVEIIIGKIRKTFTNGQVRFNEFTYTFDFPLLQEETLKLYPGSRLETQVRIKLVKTNDTEPLIFSFNGPDIVVIDKSPLTQSF